MKKLLVALLVLFLNGCTAEKTEKSITEPGEVKKMDLSNKKVLMVLAPEKFRDEEYFIPRQVLERYGIKVFTASNKKEAISVIEQKKVTVDILLENATTDYDAIIFVGGPGAAGYFNDQTALDLAKDFCEENKVVAAICISPTILANAGILEGKKATVWPSESKNLKAKGATYTSQPVTQDGKIITANGPDAAKDFAETIVKSLK
ncbi:MAG: DJ-1/PfpI family protein [Nanoarchaeota archaeon]|nr:DJ-1/PfpI family protein [Nanoarchaeota archaeon]